MRKVFKNLLAVLFVCVLSSHVFAADGTVTYVKGKVEVKRGDSWVSLRVGDKVSQSEMVSTGFQSEAKIKLMESVLYLGPVTRVTLDQLASSSSRDKVNVYLSTGTARSKVNRTDDKRVSYTVRTPIAVASVRGTDLAMDGAGNLFTISGFVAYSTNQDLGVTGDRLVYYDEEDDGSDDLDNDKFDNDFAETGDPTVGHDGAKKTKEEVKMENSKKLPNKLVVSANHGMNPDDASKFKKPTASITGNAMNVLQSVASESSKSSANQGSQSVSTSISNAVPGAIVSSPKTGSINVHVSEPTTGNVSVDVVLPQ